MKMQISFWFWKRYNDKQIIETKKTKKKKKDHDNKNIKNMFQQKYIDNTW